MKTRSTTPWFNGTTFTFLVLSIGSGTAVYVLQGAGAVGDVLLDVGAMAVHLVPMIVAGLAIGGFVQTLVDRDKVTRHLGAQSGWRGLVLASVAGMATPGGPFTSFPLVYALYAAGADIGALVAYITAWSLLGLNRLLIWELPFLGVDYSILRILISVPFPIAAGLLARYLVGSFGLPDLEPINKDIRP